MLRKIIIFNFLILFFFNKVNSTIYLIGHAYGAHGEKNIPYVPLKKFLDNNQSDFLFFLGDVTENSNDFFKFNESFKNKKKKYIRGNHDGNLYEKVEKWSDIKIKNLHFFNLDMNSDMKFDTTILNKKNKIFLTHHIFFDSVFKKISPANFMENPGININKTNFGKNNYLISGDCGAYKLGYSYLYAEFKSNYFICSGIGSGWANNIYDIKNKIPIFFDSNGLVIKHFCVSSEKATYAKKIEICLPKYNLKSIYMVLKFYKNLYFD